MSALARAVQRHRVVELDIGIEQVALREVRGEYRAAEGKKVFEHIIAQSGGQFPVAGVVYEDIIPADGVTRVLLCRATATHA